MEQITPQAVRRMFELDLSEREKGTAMSREDIKFCETVERGIVHLEDLHYEMPLPFKHANIQLPNNYAQAEKRLIGLKGRLKADERYYANYCSFMSDIISKGYSRKVMSSKMKLEEPGTSLIMGSITHKRQKYMWCLIVWPHLKDTS